MKSEAKFYEVDSILYFVNDYNELFEVENLNMTADEANLEMTKIDFKEFSEKSENTISDLRKVMTEMGEKHGIEDLTEDITGSEYFEREKEITDEAEIINSKSKISIKDAKKLYEKDQKLKKEVYDALEEKETKRKKIYTVFLETKPDYRLE